MRHKSGRRGTASERAIKDIRRATRKHYSAEEKIRIVLDGLRGEETIADSHGNAAVLFADISGFTELTRRISPQHLVEYLDAVPEGRQVDVNARDVNLLVE